VLRLTASDAPIPFTVSGVLAALAKLPCQVAAGATESFSARPHGPNRDEPSIEVPGRLVLSPRQGERWPNAAAIDPDRGPIELWDARLSASTAGRRRT